MIIRFSGYRVKHQGIIQEIRALAHCFQSVTVVKVPAHADEMGNEGADRLAKKQIRRLLNA